MKPRSERFTQGCRVVLTALATLAIAGCGATPAAPPAAAPSAAQPPAAAAPAQPAQPAAAPAQSAAAPTQSAAAPAKPTAASAPPAPPAATGATTHLRLGMAITKQALSGEIAVTLADRVKERSNGRLAIDVFDNAQLGGELEVVNSLRQGTVDLSLNGVGLLGTIEPKMLLFEQPYLWKSPETLHKVLDSAIGQQILGLLEAKGMKGLIYGEWGARDLLVRTKPVKTLDDLKGMKVRVVESPIYVATWRALGANPAPMAWPEVYTGLQQGTIDAVDAQPFGHRDAKQYEVAKYLALTDHIYTAIVLSMNLQKWQGLAPDLQQIVMDAVKEGQQLNRARAQQVNADAVETMKAQGVQVTTPDRDAFRAKVADVYKQFEGQIGADLIKQVQDAQQ